MVNSERCRSVPALAILALPALVLAIGGCTPDIDAGADPLVITDDGMMSTAEASSPERAAAVAQMRANASAGDILPYPDAFQREQTLRLAARSEPRPVMDSEAIQAELASIARREAGAISPQEIAALKARAAELQRLAARMQAR